MGISTFNDTFTDDDFQEAERYLSETPPSDVDPALEALVVEIIGRVADKWTMLILEELHEHEVLRFSQLGRQVEGISQKMLTQTLRFMERDGLIERKVYPQVPPKVEYRLTEMGEGLGRAFCGVWIWAERNREAIEKARADYEARAQT